jgi:hypothetical protein
VNVEYDLNYKSPDLSPTGLKKMFQGWERKMTENPTAIG